MSIYRMNTSQFGEYCEAANASIMTVCAPAPREAQVFTGAESTMTMLNFGDGVTLIGDSLRAPFMQKHDLKEYRAFCEDPNTTHLQTFSRPREVKIYRTPVAVVVVIDDGSEKLAVIGDSVGVHWGEDAPEYLA